LQRVQPLSQERVVAVISFFCFFSRVNAIREEQEREEERKE